MSFPSRLNLMFTHDFMVRESQYLVTSVLVAKFFSVANPIKLALGDAQK